MNFSERNSVLILTCNINYTPMQIIDNFSQFVKPSNISILIDHLTFPELSCSVAGFIEEDGDIFFKVAGEFIKCTAKK